MRWPWTKYQAERDDFDGRDAREEAVANLASAHAKWPEVNRVSQSLRELRERNHFSDQVRLIFRGELK